MKKRIRILMPVLVTLAMVVSLFGMAIPALASEITATKDVTDPFVPNIYYVGDTIYYEMTVENPVGNDETNTLTRIWDNLPDGTVIEFLAPAETLVQAPGDMDYFYAEYVVAETDLGWIVPPDPSIDPYWGVINVFEAEGYDTAADSVYAYVEKNSQVIRPEISIEKLVDFDGDAVFTDLETNYAGEAADWYIEVTNTGYDPVYNIYVTDDNGTNYGPFDLNPGDSEVIPVYTTYPMADFVNTACAEGVDDLGNPVGPVCDPAEVVVVDIPNICVEKTVDCNDDGIFLDEDWGYAGDTGHWRIVVTNCGDTTLYDVGVSDSNMGMLEIIPEFAPGDSRTYEYDTVVNEDTTNVAYADGFDVLGTYVSDEDWATNYVISPEICIEKTVDCNDDGIFLDEDTGIVGDTGHWRIVVTNCGDTTLYDVGVSDSNMGMLEVIPEFAPGDSRTYEYDTVVNEDTTNVAYADGFDELGGYWYDEDDATNYVINPCIDIQKTVDCNDDGIFLDEDIGTAGDTGHWRIVVTNCGEADLFDVMVWDTNGMSWGPFDLAAGDFVQYDYDTIVNETTTNVAYVEGYDAIGGVWYDEDDATNVVTGGEGCTPGYWKNNADKWEASAWVGYLPADSFETVFGVDVELNANGKATYPTPTLLEALDANGGGINALARHAVAALLNISNPDIGYGIGNTAALIAMVHDAIVSGDESQIEALHVLLADYNEAGCPLNQRGEPIIPDGGMPV